MIYTHSETRKIGFTSTRYFDAPVLFVFNMDFFDKDDFSYASVYRCGIKSLNYFYHIAFLETCKSYKLIPAGLALKKQPFIPFEDGDLIATWNETILHTEEQLLETLILGINERRVSRNKLLEWD